MQATRDWNSEGKISDEELREMFRYDPEQGLVYRVANCLPQYLGVVGTLTNEGYLMVNAKGGYPKVRALLIHRLAWFLHHGQWPSHTIDHIDGNKLNNRLSNLRDVTVADNIGNNRTRKRCKLNPQLPHGVRQIRLPSGAVRYMATCSRGGVKMNRTAGTLSEAIALRKRLKREMHNDSN
jgi:hypothetical protein